MPKKKSKKKKSRKQKGGQSAPTKHQHRQPAAAPDSARWDAACDAAFERPATKTCPEHFSTIDEAEAAGWVWKKGCWKNRTVRAGLKAMEEELGLLTEESLELKSDEWLRDELSKLDALTPQVAQSGMQAAQTGTPRPQLVRAILQRAELVRVMARQERRNKMAGQETKQHGFLICSGCKQFPEKGKKLKKCSRCMGVQYCSIACRDRHEMGSHGKRLLSMQPKPAFLFRPSK